MFQGRPALLGGDDHADQVAGREDGAPSVRLTGHRPQSAAAARHLARTITHLREGVLSDPEIADQPLIAARRRPSRPPPTSTTRIR
ncbi:hypothetical protein ACFV2Z_10025 [Streptomyces sp. NPDC059688]|uniref:hypothetical protein n=1 Tax=unclassified Streptomyces TaxID=2593676 RepID=UPI001A7E0DBD|nr:hypothetical protein [Streptomyces sp. CB01883]